MGKGDTYLNALLGAVVTVFVQFVPLSPVLGGGVAAYLQGGDQSESVRIGLLSGAIAAVPFVVVVLLLFSFIGVFATGTALFGLVAAFILVFAVAYTVGLSALGGYLGWYVRSETDVDL